MKNKPLYFFIGLFLLFSCGKKEPAQKEIPKKKDNSLELFLSSYESFFKTQWKATGCPGASVCIVKDSTVIYMKSFGVREKGKPELVDNHTVFRIASLSKGMSAIVTGILVQKGLINWNDKVVSYLPYFKLKDTAQTNRITIQHLLSHTTGLPKYSLGKYIEDGMTMKEIIGKMKNEDLDSTEGTSYAYNNAAFSVIEEIVKTKTGKEFTQWMQDEFFKKLPAQHVSITYDDMMQESNKAIPHDRNGSRRIEPVEIHPFYYNTAAAGGVNASITDMSLYLQVLLGNRPDIANEALLNTVFTPVIEMNPGKKEESLEYYDEWDGVQHSWYGLGFRMVDFGNKKIITHGGYVNSYRSEIGIDRQKKIAICVLFNAPNSYATTFIPTFFNYYDFYLGMKENK